jgi:hypothetical protein
MNLVALKGRLSSPPTEKLLESGTRMMSLQVTVEGPGGKGESVPVAWFDPERGALDLDAADQVLVVGRVRRRFFRAGSTTQSRTEVLAETVVPAQASAAVRRALAGVVASLAEALDSEIPAPAGRSRRGRG